VRNLIDIRYRCVILYYVMKIPKSLEFDKILDMLAEKAVSIPGAEKARKLIPVTEAADATALMEQTLEGEALLARRPTYPVRAFSAIGAELKRMKTGGILSAGELMRVNSVMKAAKNASPLAREEGTPVITNMAKLLFYDERLIKRIDECIISETEIADGASSELMRIRRAIRKENDNIKEKLQSLIRSQSESKYLQDAIITQRNGRYVVPVKAEYKGNVQGIVHERSASGATLFVEPAGVVDSNNRIRELEGAEAAEISRILTELSVFAGGYREELKEDIDVLTELDLIFAKASLARSMDANPVEFNDENVIKITEGRHPLIESDKVVPVTVEMRDGVRALIVTGPNTGGKTVTLKLVGLFCVMAQAGLFIPAKPTVSLPVFDGFFADIGDEQSIQQSLSTFSAHMKSIIFAVKHAGSHSLVLLDELGAGTDPQEGSALAQAVLTYLSGRGCMLIATTHIGELKAFAVKNDGFENASMEFDAATLTPTYHLIMGVAGKSNALTISRSLGLPKDIVASAQGFMQIEAVEYDRLLESAQKDRAKAAANLKKANKLLEDARREKERAERIHEKAAEKRKRVLEQANEKAIEIIDDARRTTEEAIDAAKKLGAKPEAERTKLTKQVRDKLTDKKQYIQKHDKIQKKKTQKPLDSEAIREGDTVLIIAMNAPATVLSPPDAKGMVKLQAGIMKTEIHYSELARTEGQEKVEKQYLPRVDMDSRRNISMSLDLHGETVDDAIIILDKYLDDAFLSGLSQVSIVHGRGTGVLRKGIQDYLRKHPHVKSMRQGAYDEGGIGATIVTLK